MDSILSGCCTGGRHSPTRMTSFLYLKHTHHLRTIYPFNSFQFSDYYVCDFAKEFHSTSFLITQTVIVRHIPKARWAAK